MKKNEHVNGICCGYTKDGHGVVKIDGKEKLWLCSFIKLT